MYSVVLLAAVVTSGGVIDKKGCCGCGRQSNCCSYTSCCYSGCGYGYAGGGYGYGYAGGYGYGGYAGIADGGIYDGFAMAQNLAPASILVNLPAGASLTVDGQQTTGTAETRVFSTPNLQYGQAYHYTLQVAVTHEGRTLTQQQHVNVEAGRQSAVTFDFSSTAVANR